VHIPTIQARPSHSTRSSRHAPLTAAAYERASRAVTYLRGMAYLAAGSGTEAAARFQTILDHPGQNRTNVHYALPYVGLARAAAMGGDRPKARKAYQDFLALWKDADQDADQDIPVLAAAKAEYEKGKFQGRAGSGAVQSRGSAPPNSSQAEKI